MSDNRTSGIRSSVTALVERAGSGALLTPLGLGRATTKPNESDSREVAQLLESSSLREAIEQLARESGQDAQEVLADAAGYLRELSATHVEFVTTLWQRFSKWMLRGYDTVLDEDHLEELRRLDRDHSLIFLISHRSYLDEFAFPPALLEAGLAPCYGLAGANLDFFPLGNIAKRTGIVHIRRATQGSPVYRMALRYFVGQLVHNRANLIWSIEGGRSRTGKLRPPRYGLLRYVADAVEATNAPEAMIVPVSIGYDQLPMHEVTRMTDEARGRDKQQENLRWLIGYARALRHSLGRVYVDFGKPLRLQDRLNELRSQDESQRFAVERIALEVCHRINRATPVTPTAAVCVAVLSVNRALTLDEVHGTVEPLATYLQRRGYRVAGDADLTNPSTLRAALRNLVHAGVLASYSEGAQPVWEVRTDQHLVAAVYRNSAVHVLLGRAITELALLSLAHSHTDLKRTAWDEALRLRELLKFDFFFAQRDEFADELYAELEILADTGGSESQEITIANAHAWLHRANPLVAHLVLRPFIDSYRIVADQLADLDTSTDLDDATFIDHCLKVGTQWAMQRRLHSDESVSAEMFRTALKLCHHRDLIRSDTPDLADRRQAFANELAQVADNIAEIAQLSSRRDA